MTSREITQFMPLTDDGVWPEDVQRSASDVLHVILYGAMGWPWLVRSLSGGTQEAKQALLKRLDLAPDALPHLGSWKADTGFLHEHGVDADMRATPFKPSPNGWPGIWYDHGPLPAEIDLLIVDGPPWAIHPYVRGAADSLFDRMAVGGTVLLDDAARPGERVVARKWRKRWPNFEFELIQVGTKGTLVGRRLR
jgi:hypothetical protein